MSSPASIKGHPIHAMLVPLPIGLWIFALVADMVAATTGSPEWRTVAFYSIGGGIVGALLAAVPGLVDLVSFPRGPVKSIGLWHMGINLLAVAVSALNFYIRWNHPDHAGPLPATILGVVLIGVSGWLGGSMVYRHGVAVDTGGPSEAPAHSRTR